jgi:hypothetical protein
VLDQVINAVRAGESRVLVVHGEAGIGKTALLDYLAGRASGCRVVRVVGMQSEMELAFAGLHQLCAPMLDHLEGLPVPQRDALRIVFGLSAGPAPDRFLVGLAVLSLVSEAAGERPLICLVEDQQWLDQASAQALGFVARRLAAEPVGLIFAARVLGDDVVEVSRAARALPPPAHPPGPADLLLDGLALLVTDGPAAAAATLRQAARALPATSPQNRFSGGAGWPRQRTMPCGTTVAGA